MATSVKEVVLPYLNRVDRLVAAARDDAAGTLSGEFLTFLADVEGWFDARGVERITFIMPRDDDEDGDGPELPWLDGGGEGPISAKWWHTGRKASTTSVNPRTRSKGPEVQKLETGASLHLRSASGALDWLLVPYAHRPSDAKLLAFQRAMSRKFGPKYPSRLRATLSDTEVREKIRECYDLIWSDHNLVSMALYAGPTDSGRWEGDCLHTPGWWRDANARAIGWLGTGDMHLNGSRRRQALIQYYDGILDQVNVFGLPHHGSHRNFHASLLTRIPNLTQCVAEAGPNGYGHPNAAVRHVVESSGREFVHVSDPGRSVLQWRHRR